MVRGASFIGFGEAGMAFAAAGTRGYDRKLDARETAAHKLEDFRKAGIAACGSAAEALSGADVIFSLVTAHQALIAAYDNASAIAAGALWLDMNSVAPDTKRTAAAAIGKIGRYVDVAVMSPVVPLGLGVPLLLSGPHAAAGAIALKAAGFRNLRIVGDRVGQASAIKMFRSVMVKGLEALSAECALAADASGVLEEVVSSLDASEAPKSWADRFDYNLGRMMAHGERRAAEMMEVVRTLDALGTGSGMSYAAMIRQADVGQLAIDPPDGLVAKLRAVRSGSRDLETAA